MERRVAIIGDGISGLIAYEYPSNQQVMEYLKSYAEHFAIIPYIRFNSKVIDIDYVGESIEEMKSWDLWGGTGKPFGSKGKWHIAVQDTKSLSTERWGISKFVDLYLRWKLPLKKYDAVHSHSFLQAISSCQIGMLPENFFDKVKEGSIDITRSHSFSFCRDGLMINGEAKTQKLKSIFKSPNFQSYFNGSATSAVPLYRQIIKARIPQVAIIGYAEGLSNLFASEMRCQWLAELLDGWIKLPSIREMEKNMKMWEDHMKLYGGRYYRRSCIVQKVEYGTGWFLHK
ncbi:hypothetical protein L6164_011471 [Bauhinia variegata]|uniref:Uncharacterized protein n=1 Tax=Bauhinia variegata TaxID=167791 RepID=A0ACB9P6S1_BAUVA|nr:hypothetical protein L6164_011471 [Bauhinia variegata]